MSTNFLSLYLLFACLWENKGLKGKKSSKGYQSPCREKTKMTTQLVTPVLSAKTTTHTYYI